MTDEATEVSKRLEAVARAICRAVDGPVLGDAYWRDYVTAARKAIEAMETADHE